MYVSLCNVPKQINREMKLKKFSKTKIMSTNLRKSKHTNIMEISKHYFLFYLLNNLIKNISII